MALFDFLFGSDERPYRSSNWTDREDWDCGEPIKASLLDTFGKNGAKLLKSAR